VAGEIVLGYDGQVASRAALRAAVSVAGAFARPLVLVFGFEPNPLGGEVRDLRHAVRDVGEKLTAEAVQEAKTVDANVNVLVELVDDRPADAILRAADEHDAFAIVVGATNRGPLTGALLGSVTYQVVHRSTRPVLVVPAADHSG
jgi:nucleotide-binding universal stress UspA family protein